MCPHKLNLPFKANEQFYTGKEPNGYVIFLVKIETQKLSRKSMLVKLSDYLLVPIVNKRTYTGWVEEVPMVLKPTKFFFKKQTKNQSN